MPFEYIGVPEGAKFTHRQSEKIFVCSRSRQDNDLIFQIREGNSGNVVGYVCIAFLS